MIDNQRINYDSKTNVLSRPGESGSIIGDICGRIGHDRIGGSGKTAKSDLPG